MTAAQADAGLQEASPAAGEEVTEPLTEVVLTFGEDLLTLEGSTSSVIEVRDPSGELVNDGETVVEGPTMRADVAPVTNGEYTVTWQTVGADGHTVSDEYTFRYLAGEGEAAPAPSTDPSEGTSADPDPAAFPVWAIVLIAAGVVLVAVLGILAVRRARRARAGDDAPRPE